MATISTTVCDFHLADGEQIEGKTRNVVIDGHEKPDLCDDCYDQYVQPLKYRMDQAAGKPKRKPAAKKKARKRGPRPAAVRAWAAENGIEVAPTGRVPRDVVEKYQSAS